MVSEKQLAANRANALHSTGPRTEEGKSVSRRNSLKEGYTGAGIVMTADEAIAVEDKRAALADYIEPRNIVEQELVERMALASVRMERCRRVEEARIEKRRVGLERRYTRKREKEVQPAIEAFASDPKRGYPLLLESALGCHHLRTHWQALAAVLDSRGYWNDEELALAQRLLGAEPAEANLEHSDVWLLRVHNALAKRSHEPAPAHEALRKLGHLSDDAAKQLLADQFGTNEPDPAEARARLGKFVAARVAALCDRAGTHWRERERFPYVLETTLTLVDSSPDALRLARYEAMNEATFHRSWKAIQKQRRDEEAARADRSGRPPQNEPISLYVDPDEYESYGIDEEPTAAAPEAAPSEPTSPPAPAANYMERHEALVAAVHALRATYQKT